MIIIPKWTAKDIVMLTQAVGTGSGVCPKAARNRYAQLPNSRGLFLVAFSRAGDSKIKIITKTKKTN